MISGKNVAQTRLLSLLVALTVFIFSAGFLFIFKNNDAAKNFFMCIAMIVSYYAYHNLSNGSSFKKLVLRGALIGIAAVLLSGLIIITVKASTSGNQWDFLCFYLEGLLGVHHLDFYDPHSFVILMDKINFHPVYDSAFKAETLDVGVVSPPITMLIYVPLAYIDYSTARIIFTVLIFIFILGSIFAAHKLVQKKERSAYSLLFTLIILLFLPGTNSTMIFSQTNFFLLFFLILAVLHLESPMAGVYLALSVIFKPISVILILFFLLHKKWKPVFYFVGTGVLLTLVTAFAWGFRNIVQYFLSPPTKRIPFHQYTEDINQSVIAVLNRSLKPLGMAQYSINLLYYFCVAVLIVVTCMASKKLFRSNRRLSFLPFIPCMLLIYPGSADNYMVYLLPVFIWFLFSDLKNKYFYSALLMAIVFLRIAPFFAYLVLLFIFIGIAFPNMSGKIQKLIADRKYEGALTT
jgi:hypothetical protein